MGWKTTFIRDDGKKSQMKKSGSAWATVWEDGFNSAGWSHWAVYVGDGSNEVASGATRTFIGSKIAAAVALKKAAIDAAKD